MSKMAEKLASLEARKLALADEEKQIIQARKLEVATLIEKIPGALTQDNMILAGIIADGLGKLKNNPSLAKEFESAALGLPSFRKPKTKASSENSSADKGNV